MLPDQNDVSVSGRRLIYDRPARNFNEALPIGNGRLGAMIYGGVAVDRMSVNDDRLWAGVAAPKPREDGPTILAEARALFKQGRRKDTQRLLEEKFTTAFNQPYQPAGTLTFKWSREEACQHYQRTLKLGEALAEVEFRQDQVSTRAEYFSSASAQVIVAQFTSSGGLLSDLTLGLESPLRHVTEAGAMELVLRGRSPSHVRWNGVDDSTTPENMVSYDEELSRRFAISVRVVDTDGQVNIKGNCLLISRATRIVLMVATATDARGANEAAIARADIDAARRLDVSGLRAEHIVSHRRLFDQIGLKLDGVLSHHKFTNERIAAAHAGDIDVDLIATQFDVGRYLLISASRPGSMPANLQGIWNERVDPPWWSNYTLNINLEMNYWPAAPCGLLECAEPLYDFVAALAEKGKATARIMYDARGWVANHQTDYLLQTTPVGHLPYRVYEESAKWALWPFGGAWLCLHLFEHYEYTLDRQFLERSYPLLKGAAEFMLDWLVEDPDQPALLATVPSTSPENTYRFSNGDVCAVSKSSTMDIAIIRALFDRCRQAGKILGLEDTDFMVEIAEAMPRLPGTPVSTDGRILEFDGNWLEAEHPHRHISHLFDLCPNNRITLEKTPDLAAAALKALQYRGEIGVGWTMPWKARCYARLKDGEKALKFIRGLMAPVDIELFDAGYQGGGIYPNMLTACPPFNIDSNFAVVNAIIELFVQDHSGFVDLLPACPTALANGELRGIHLRGNRKASFAWKDGKVVWLTITSPDAGAVEVKLHGRIRNFHLERGQNSILLQETNNQ